ncbi:MAG: DUF805 domain-containing protein [Bacteroidia bacterium]
MFKKVFSFDGRIRRLEFWLTYLGFSVGYGIIRSSMEGNLVDVFLVLALIPFYWILFAAATKRCHDRGNPAGYMFIPFYAFWMFFAAGDAGHNQYGPNPKLPKDMQTTSYDELIEEIGNDQKGA